MTCSVCRLRMRLSLLLAAVAAAAAGAAAAPAGSPEPACATLQNCLDRLGEEMPEAQRMAFHARLKSFGPAAADALVHRLRDPNPKVAQAAGVELAQFQRIDPKHLPALIAADRAGNGWLPRAVAATGEEEALLYLQERFLRNPDFSNNTQVHMALARFGNRLAPFVAAQAERCRAEGNPNLCAGVLSLIGEVGRSSPQWGEAAVARIASSPLPDARRRGEDALIGRRHPLGLHALKGRIEAFGGAMQPRGWQIENALVQAGRYGPVAAPLGPAIAAFLDSADAELPARAALALAQIASPAGAERLIALEPGFEDDWLLAYNALEALGRARVAEARPLIERARSHWHAAVRNNAQRALNSLAGGDFARPAALAGPAGKQPRGHFPLSDLRFGDDAAPAFCGAKIRGSRTPLPQDPPGAVSWPASGAERLAFESPARPSASMMPPPPPGRPWGRIVFRLPLGSGYAVGHESGEFGGGIVHIRPDGGTATIADGNPAFAVPMGGRWYVAEGLSHLGLDRGSLIVLDSGGRVARRIRLPASPREAIATESRTLVIRTGGGDIAIREDGRLVDPSRLALCGKDDR
jgi:hypothetical protein